MEPENPEKPEDPEKAAVERAEQPATAPLPVLELAENDGHQVDRDEEALEEGNSGSGSGEDAHGGSEPLALMDLQNGLVGWDSPADRANPRCVSVAFSPSTSRPERRAALTCRNFPAWKKYYIMIMMGIISTLR